MKKYLAGRILLFFPVLIAVASLTFLLVRMAPGDPFADEKNIPQGVKDEIIAFYGLDAPLYEQYFIYLGNLARLDLGYSYSHPGYQVGEIITNHFPITLAYALPGFLLALGIGIPLGACAALYYQKAGDWFASGFAMLGICLPTFVTAPLLALFFGTYLGWLPSVGWGGSENPGTGYTATAYRILPALTIALLYAAFITRLVRSGFVESLQSDYIRTAYAKGLSPVRIICRHALPMSLLPVINFLGPALAGILTGSFVIEIIFNIPGLGRFFVEAAINRDYPLLLGLVVFYAGLILCFNLLADILQAWLNPRIREAYSHD